MDATFKRVSYLFGFLAYPKFVASLLLLCHEVHERNSKNVKNFFFYHHQRLLMPQDMAYLLETNPNRNANPTTYKRVVQVRSLEKEEGDEAR